MGRLEGECECGPDADATWTASCCAGPDGDADEEKRIKQRKEQATYSDEDDDEEDENEEANIEPPAEANETSADAVEDEDDLAGEGSFASRVSRVGELFQKNLHPATSFKFEPSGCVFELEVSLPLHARM